MSELVLYRKYRPRAFEEVVGQEHIVGSLQNALRLEKIAHAYLFSGPRGVGKTTIARLLAKGLNCANLSKISEGNFSDKLSTRRSFAVPSVASGEGRGEGGLSIPCNKCRSCSDFAEGRAMDLIEIDAASNRGIDEIRELREGVKFVPAQGKYKTYIIDEVHMLTKEAFAALLKTLEEPPPHAVFVLATTELDKVPATIISRTQHYDFRRPSPMHIAERLKLVAKKEGVTLERDAAHIIALAAEGSLRDAESILGQVMGGEKKSITRAEVEDILGLPRREAGKKLFELIAANDRTGSLALIQEVSSHGHDLQYFAKLLMRYYRFSLFLKTDISLKQFFADEMLDDEQEAIAAHLASFTSEHLIKGIDIIFQNSQLFRRMPIPQLPLELTVIELINDRQQITNALKTV